MGKHQTISPVTQKTALIVQGLEAETSALNLKKNRILFFRLVDRCCRLNWTSAVETSVTYLVEMGGQWLRITRKVFLAPSYAGSRLPGHCLSSNGRQTLIIDGAPVAIKHFCAKQSLRYVPCTPRNFSRESWFRIFISTYGEYIEKF